MTAILDRIREWLQPNPEEPTEEESVEVREAPLPPPSDYPQSFSDFIGQEGLVTILKAEVRAALKDGEKFPHMLLYGPPGTGKTAIAFVIANELGGVPIYESTGAEFPTQKEVITAASGVGKLLQSHGKAIWLLDEADGLARIASYPLHCPVRGTKLLTSNLRWVKAEELVAGDRLIGIDEFPIGKSRRKLRPTLVTSIGESKDYCIRVFTDQGEISVNRQHPFLLGGCKKGSRKQKTQRWVQAKDLTQGAKIWFLGSPWETDATRDAGWLAGIAEGEGTLSTKTCHGKDHDGSMYLVTVSQSKTGDRIIERTVNVLKERGFNPRRYFEPRQHKGWKDSETVYLQTQREMFRYLGTIRPQRLLRLWEEILDRGIIGLPKKNGWAIVEKIEEIGVQPVVNISTSTSTYVAEGFVSHNTLATHSYIQLRGEKFYGEGITFIATTNRPAGVPRAFRSRMAFSLFFDFYSPTELSEIARRAAQRRGQPISDDLASWVGQSSAGEPRKALHLLRALRVLEVTSPEGATEALAMAGLRRGGLSKPQYEYLVYLKDVGGTAGLNTISAYLSLDAADIRYEFEQYLIRSQMVKIGGRGRTITEKGLNYLQESS